jgi:hypothetical protein
MDEDWKKQELSVIGIVERVKQSFTGRNIKVMLFLVVKEEPRDKGDLKVDDFVANIKKICQLESKSLNFIDQKDFVLGQSVSVEVCRNIIALSINFYKENIARIKKSKSDTEVASFRSKFKISFFNEILGNSSKVQKFLSQAYDLLPEIQQLDQYGDHEIRTLSDYVNLKLCLLKISDKKVDMAIKQFLDHMKWYITLKGEPELIFEHYALIYRQYRVFGENLERVVLNQQHSYGNPGYYFQSAAISSKNRKKWAQRSFEVHGGISNLKKKQFGEFKEEKFITSGYIGKRESKSDEKYFKIINHELDVNHSDDIIKMLTKSYDHYFKRNQKRMIYYIASMIADEHFSSKNWLKAKKFYERISKEYRNEKWDFPLTEILKSTMICTRNLKQSEEFIQYSIESICECQKLNKIEESTQMLNGLFKYLNKKDEGLDALKKNYIIDSNHSISLFYSFLTLSSLIEGSI